ncbi:hypothetical protein N2152v2_004561 [Parachlorella kessleri]
MAALEEPSVEAIERAVDSLQASTQQRLDAIEAAAREQSEAVGEADLRRLKRQFSSLKNTFLHYEVKQSFITGLTEGLPSGSEEAELQQVEQEVQTNVELLRGLKQQNEQVQQAIVELVDRIVDTRESFERHRSGVLTDLSRLQQDLQQHAELMQPPLPELPEGPGEEELRAALAAATATTREDEYKIAAELALAQELEAAVACEQAELDALKAQLVELETRTAAQGQKVETDSRLRQALDRCETVSSLLSMLSGITVHHADPEEVHLRLRTAGLPEHDLVLQLHPGTRLVEQAALSPADVEVADLVEGAREEGLGIHFVVREVQSRLSSLVEEGQQA